MEEVCNYAKLKYSEGVSFTFPVYPFLYLVIYSSTALRSTAYLACLVSGKQGFLRKEILL
jgi:hypothetical protein